MDILITVIFGIFGLSILVLVHESGHYIAARLCGVGVETFSIGFGKKLIGFTRKGISYQISWFLFGGYCKLKGELFKPDFTEEDFEKAKTEKGSFMAASIFRKICIVVAGPLANIIFALLVFSLIELAGYNIRVTDAKIILQPDYPMGAVEPLRIAEKAGLKSGDVILAMNDVKIDYYEDVYKIVRKSKGKELAFTVRRGDEVLTIKIKPEEVPGEYVARIGIYPWIDPLIESVRKNTPAAKAGLSKGDRILSVNSQDIPHTIALLQILSDEPKTLDIAFERNGETKKTIMDMTTLKKDKIDPGISYKQILIRSPERNPATAFLSGAQKTGETLYAILTSFVYMFRVRINDVSDVVAGPIRITQMMGQEAVNGFSISLSDGFSYFFNLICLISIILGFMNLLPIPILDGGHVVLAVIMKLRKKTGMKFLMRYQLVGFSIVILLTFLAIYSDFSFFL